MSEPNFRRGPGGLTGLDAIESVERGQTTPAGLYEDSVGRISEWEPRLGAVVDQISYQPPASGPLEGMIVGVKSQIDVAGYRNWFGLQGQGSDSEPVTQDATVVTLLRRSGATLACTTAAPFLGVPGGVTPQTRNSRSPDRVSGGSSGGSASALAAGLVHGALGSDSGGSIRIPAACCGVVGLQTTRGLVPLTRTGGLTYSIGNVGPMATSVADTRLILSSIARFSREDPYSVSVPSTVDRWNGEPLRVGLPTELAGWNIDDEVAEVLANVVDVLSSAGHQVDEFSLPILRESMDLGPRVIGVAESGAVLEENLGANSSGRDELVDAIEASKSIPASLLARAHHRTAVLRSEVAMAFEDYDVMLTPTLPCRVPDGARDHIEVDMEVGGAVETRTSALTRLVNPWNLAAVPAGTLPVAHDSGGAAISVQFIGAQFSDWKLLDVMQFVESQFGGPWDTVATPPR